MNHRVKNLFALTDGMIRQSLKHSANMEDMANALSGRLHALASAHSLVLGDNLTHGDQTALRELRIAVVGPHYHGTRAETQLNVRGPELSWHEVGGPVVERPTKAGFGSRLVELTVVRQLEGTLAYDWLPEGLAASIKLPASLFTC